MTMCCCMRQVLITNANIATVTSKLNSTLASATSEDQTDQNVELISVIFVRIANAQVNFSKSVSAIASSIIAMNQHLPLAC